MKTISPALLAHYRQDTTTLARLWKVTRRDGKVFGFTDHDEPIIYEGIVYTVTSVFDASAVQTSAAMNVDSVSAVGILATAGVTAEDIEYGLWDGASVVIVEVNYRDLSMGDNVLRVGDAGEIQRASGQYTAELRGLMQALQNNVGRIVAASCDADLGDARCKVDLEALRVSGTVTSIEEPQRGFTASAMAQAADYFTYGVVTWSTGLNHGLSMEVKRFAVGGVFELQLDMPHEIVIGDTFTVTPGCNKVGRLGDCKLKFDNYLNFRGFEDIPGQDQVLLVGGQ